MNEIPRDRSIRRSLLLRAALAPLVTLVNFAINLFGTIMSRAQVRAQGQVELPPVRVLPMFWAAMFSGIAWVILSMPLQYATRRLVRQRVSISVAGHIVMMILFPLAHSSLSIGMRAALGLSRANAPLLDQVQRHFVGMLPINLLVFAAIVAGTLAWDNWRISMHRERTAARLASELTRAELAALRSKVQPHFLFNALHGISSVMDTDVPRARQMMVALSNLLRSSLHGGGERIALEHEVQFTRDYLDLQQMRFEDRLVYDLNIDARPNLRVPAFILQPLVENAVVHGMADRSDPTHVTVAVREVGDLLEVEVSDDGPGFSQGTLDGSVPLGVGLGALRARLLALPGGGGMMTLSNRPGGGALVALRVPAFDEDGAHV